MQLRFLSLTLLILAQSSLAHHSFAPHFDSSRPVTIVGTVTEFEQRNPHAYLHISAQDADGQTHEYVCESHGVTQLSRNGITPEMLAVGTELRVDGSQHRRDPYMCFFQTVHLADGRVLDVNGSRRPRAAQPQVAQRDSIYGTWLLMPANRSTSGPNVMMNFLSSAGEQAVANYDPFVDDPTFRCEPVSPRRVWFAPGTPMSIRRAGDTIYLRHEWMDVERAVHLDMDEHPQEGERSLLGHSIGHFEEDTLVIETANFTEGVLRQYIEQENGPTLGMLHSEAFTVVERISFDAESNSISVSIQQDDPVYFTRDFNVASAQYAASDLEIQPFGCIPEILK
ncbi:DUF6152 family protein [Gammaproteobacteria bacterium]|nr:DUF6152 family protein [Gammaproteobacteria bacterium]